MDEISPEFIERYQKLYEQDPRSRIFAPLADAYRKKGWLKEARDMAEKGVKDNPEFPGGRVALGRIYMDDSRYPDAEMHFRKAVELAPESVLAYQLLAETFLRLKKTKEALKAYKMLLFMNPENERAANAVRKLEALTADEYEDDLFAMKPLKTAVAEWDNVELDFGDPKDAKAPQSSAQKEKHKKQIYLDRILSLADAHIVRNDVDRALDALNEAERLFGPQTEIVKRLKLLHERQLDTLVVPKNVSEINKSTPSKSAAQLDNQIEFLQDLLQNIKSRANSL